MNNETALPTQIGFSLSIDVIGSTIAGINLSQREYQDYSAAVVGQIQPHLDALGLVPTVIKFAGDGWVVNVTASSDSPQILCCLAIAMANRFQTDIATATSRTVEQIPSLRLSMCSGMDQYLRVTPTQIDCVGDSVRRAVRSSQFCHPNEILVDEVTRSIVFRDFELLAIDRVLRKDQFGIAKDEEELPLYNVKCGVLMTGCFPSFRLDIKPRISIILRMFSLLKKFSRT